MLQETEKTSREWRALYFINLHWSVTRVVFAHRHGEEQRNANGVLGLAEATRNRRPVNKTRTKSDHLLPTSFPAADAQQQANELAAGEGRHIAVVGQRHPSLSCVGYTGAASTFPREEEQYIKAIHGKLSTFERPAHDLLVCTLRILPPYVKINFAMGLIAMVLSDPIKYVNAFSSRQQPMAIDKLLLGAYSIEIWNYFPSIVDNFTGRMSLGAAVKTYAGMGGEKVHFRSAHLIVNTRYRMSTHTENREQSGDFTYVTGKCHGIFTWRRKNVVLEGSGLENMRVEMVRFCLENGRKIREFQNGIPVDTLRLTTQTPSAHASKMASLASDKSERRSPISTRRSDRPILACSSLVAGWLRRNDTPSLVLAYISALFGIVLADCWAGDFCYWLFRIKWLQRVVELRLAHTIITTEVNTEQRRNARAGETGDPEKKPPTSGIVRHDFHMRKSGGYSAGIHTRSAWVREKSSLTTTPLRTSTAERFQPIIYAFAIARLKRILVSLGYPARLAPGSIPGRVTPGFSQVGIVPDDAAGRRVFLGSPAKRQSTAPRGSQSEIRSSPEPRAANQQVGTATPFHICIVTYSVVVTYYGLTPLRPPNRLGRGITSSHRKATRINGTVGQILSPDLALPHIPASSTTEVLRRPSHSETKRVLPLTARAFNESGNLSRPSPARGVNHCQHESNPMIGHQREPHEMLCVVSCAKILKVNGMLKRRHRPIGPYHTGYYPVVYSVHYWPAMNQWGAELILTQLNAYLQSTPSVPEDRSGNIRIAKQDVSIHVEDEAMAHESRHESLFSNTVRCVIGRSSGCDNTCVLLSLLEEESANEISAAGTSTAGRGRHAVITKPSYLQAKHCETLYLSSTTLPARNKLAFKNTLAWVDTRTLTACISVRLIRAYPNNCFVTIQPCWCCFAWTIRIDDRVNTDMLTSDFIDMCALCWKEKYGFLTIVKDYLLHRGRYRRGFDQFTAVCREGSSTGNQQVISSVPPATSVGTVSTDDNDTTVNAIVGMSAVQSVCAEGSSALNTDEHTIPATQKSKLDIEDVAGSEADHKDSIDDDYGDSDSVEDDDYSLDSPIHFPIEFPSTSNVKKAEDIEYTDDMFTEDPNKLVDGLKYLLDSQQRGDYSTMKEVVSISARVFLGKPRIPLHSQYRWTPLAVILRKLRGLHTNCLIMPLSPSKEVHSRMPATFQRPLYVGVERGRGLPAQTSLSSRCSDARENDDGKCGISLFHVKKSPHDDAVKSGAFWKVLEIVAPPVEVTQLNSFWRLSYRTGNELRAGGGCGKGVGHQGVVDETRVTVEHGLKKTGHGNFHSFLPSPNPLQHHPSAKQQLISFRGMRSAGGGGVGWVAVLQPSLHPLTSRTLFLSPFFISFSRDCAPRLVGDCAPGNDGVRTVMRPRFYLLSYRATRGQLPDGSPDEQTTAVRSNLGDDFH
ncbi:hypothetical protein PR048_028750 [Dryococelus australis]|uniref:Uncharacterized protein n=1 Tax=Dryococelus australis TaxID=614101 RepID=A0ABQ9GE31_9NEOP|nr:hypothetical protein PR048_028750 [Dryococelus australis]